MWMLITRTIVTNMRRREHHYGIVEFAGLDISWEMDGQHCRGGHCRSGKVAWVVIAGLDNDRLQNAGLEFGGLVNDGLKIIGRRDNDANSSHTITGHDPGKNVNI